MTSTADAGYEVVLNAALDREALARAFANKGRIRINDFMVPSYADAMYEVFRKHVPWSLVYNNGDENFRLPPDEFAALSADERARIKEEVLRRAQTEFQFLYSSFQIVSSYFDNDYPNHPFYGLLEYINGPEFLGFIGAVTGLTNLVKADAQATLFAPGQFLTLHDDRGKTDEGWQIAYVMSFTKDWRADWGGVLHFYDDDRKTIIDSLVPQFNAISMFRVPTPHSVSMVTPFAKGGRYSITGWLRDR